MARSFVVLLSIPALISVIPGINAANCKQAGLSPSGSWAEDLQQAACANSECAVQEGQAKCELTMPIGGGWVVTYSATDSAEDYDSWYIQKSTQPARRKIVLTSPLG